MNLCGSLSKNNQKSSTKEKKQRKFNKPTFCILSTRCETLWNRLFKYKRYITEHVFLVCPQFIKRFFYCLVTQSQL